MEKMLGVMLDCSRNSVLNVETVKKYADIIKKMGYNTLMLYTEETYEVDNQPFFGHLRGRYSKEELKELDTYCKNIGIELVPCIQTLAHLEIMFKWGGVYADVNDCADILLVDEEKTYKLIEDMISSLRQCFSTNKIHIGMDEAHRVGTGKYKKNNNETEDRFDIINRHLHRVCEIADKYGFEPMIWSDMFCKLALNVEDQYESSENAEKILEKAQLPENVSLVHWDYYSEDYNRYANMIKTNKLFGRKVYFAGGAWTWKGFSPDNDYSMKTTKASFKACNDIGVDGMLITVWGDNGGECSKFAVLPSLMYASEISKGNFDMENIKEKFKDATGCDFDSFLLFDKLDTPGSKHSDNPTYSNNPSKYLLYNDIFMGIRDYLCSMEDGKYYSELAQKIYSADGKGEFGYLFERFGKLAEVLSIKANLGIRIREAYLKKDMPGLKAIVNDCDTLLKKLKEFHKIYQSEWFLENKPHGFDVQDIRLGGLMQRIESCKDRLIQYINGEIHKIPEIEEPVLNQKNGRNTWQRIVTVNNI